MRRHPWSSRLLFVFVTLGLFSSCGVLDPPQDPDKILHIRSLSPQLLVTQELFAAAPDSGGAGTLTHLRYSLTTGARQALQTGAILEAVVRVPPGSTTLEGWVESSGTWNELLEGTVSGSDPGDLWWRRGWTNPAAGAALLTQDNLVRLKVTPGAYSSGSILRVIEIAAGLGVYQTPTGVSAAPAGLASSGGGLAILGTGIINTWSVQGEELDQVVAANPPLSFCRLGNFYYGTTASEIRRVPLSGGTWQRKAMLPWSNHGGVALAADANDLYLIRYPAGGESNQFPTLYKLSVEILVNTSSFRSATKDSATLRRNGMLGGNTAGFAWWDDEWLLVAPGSQEEEFGLVTFSRAGWFQNFIPLPFEPGSVKFAFAGDYLFVGGARPTVEALAWSPSHQPAAPGNGFIYRWSAP